MQIKTLIRSRATGFLYASAFNWQHPPTALDENPKDFFYVSPRHPYWDEVVAHFPNAEDYAPGEWDEV